MDPRRAAHPSRDTDAAPALSDAMRRLLAVRLGSIRSARTWYVDWRKIRHKGWTMIEMILVVTIISTLFSIMQPMWRGAVEKARVARAIGDIEALSIDLLGHEYGEEGLPNSLEEVNLGRLDPWGTPYQFLNFGCDASGGGGKGKGGGGGGCAVPGSARKDRFLVPLNSTFDLYSMGADGDTQPPLTAPQSKDDIVRANDGGFVGLASKY